MTTPDMVLDALRNGGREALDRLLPLVYDELRVIAHRHLSRRPPGGTLVTTALVHEAYLKMVDQAAVHWNDRAHFRALASVAMRHVIVDRARSRGAVKRHGVSAAVT